MIDDWRLKIDDLKNVRLNFDLQLGRRGGPISNHQFS